MVRHQVTGSSGFDSHPEIFCKLKNFEGGESISMMDTFLPSFGGIAMLKKRDLQEAQELYELMVHPEVFPFVRHKAYSYEEFLFLTKQTIEAEEQGQLVSRTILDEWGAPIGTINLFDVQDGAGFLGTWLGKPYHGKGYNQIAKDQFFDELFYELDIQSIFMRVRKINIRSTKAVEKLPYAILANETRMNLLNQINNGENIYNLYEISKDQYTLYKLRSQDIQEEQHLKEA